MALEPEFWAALTRIAAREGRSLAALVADIDARRTHLDAQTGDGPGRPLASSLRVHALEASR